MSQALPISHAEVIAWRRANPCLTLETVGFRFGVTRERIRQILAKAGEPTFHYRISKPTRICMQCGTGYIKGVWSFAGVFLCSVDCRLEYYHPLVQCEVCGGMFRRRASHLMRSSTSPTRQNSQLFVACGKRCQGIYAGRHFGAQPGEKRNEGTRKWDEALILAERERTGESYRMLGHRLGIPPGTIYEYMARHKRSIGNSHED